MPAVGYSVDWWELMTDTIMPKKNSRIGTLKEYYAFLGVLIKELIEQGYTISSA